MPKLLSPQVMSWQIHDEVFDSEKGKDEKDLIKIGVSPDDPILVTFRQATAGEDEKRMNHLSSDTKREWSDGGVVDTFEANNMPRQRAVEVWLTMHGCNITDEDGEPLFKGYYSSPDLFMEDWGKLPVDWARIIHSCCAHTNPDWAVPLYEENSVLFKVESEGEESGVKKEK